RSGTVSSEEKARWSAAYKEQQQQHCNAVGAELKQARINLERTLTEESCWREASRLTWLTRLHARLLPQQPSAAAGAPKPTLSALVTSLNTLYHEQPFYRRWWWYLRHRWWRVHELTVASDLLSQWPEGPLTQKELSPFSQVLQRTQGQLSRWNWLFKVVKTMREKMEQRVDLTQKPAVLKSLEALWTKGRKRLKRYGAKGMFDADGAFSFSDPNGLLERYQLTEPKACEEQRLKLAQMATSQEPLGAYGWLGRRCPDAVLRQKRELVYYRLLEDCLQQLQNQQKAYWKKAQNYRKQVQRGRGEEDSRLLEQLGEAYLSWHTQMMGWLSLLREGLMCLAPDSPLGAIYQHLAQGVTELVDESDEASLGRRWVSVLCNLKVQLKALLAYTQNPAAGAEGIAADEGLVLLRFIDEVYALRHLPLTTDDPLQHALWEQREALQHEDLAPLCLEGIGQGLFDVPLESKARALHKVMRQYQQAQAEQKQQMVHAPVPAPTTNSLEPLNGLYLTDDILSHWLRGEDEPEVQFIKQDFMQRLQELEQLNEAMRQAQDESSQEPIRKQIKACSKAYTLKYHPDKIRSYLNEDLATRMFVTFRKYLERALQGTSSYASTGQVYASDPYFEELIRVMEEELRIKHLIIQVLQEMREEDKQHHEEIKQHHEEIKQFCQKYFTKVDKLSERVDDVLRRLDELLASDEESESDEAIIVESNEEAHSVAAFHQPYHPGFWENPSSVSANVKVKSSVKRQSLL
ncbi:MAG: hypothetical protein Q8M40_03535, partial [Legionella sp.]|nr:hypothetical protein [Legionella sp.]